MNSPQFNSKSSKPTTKYAYSTLQTANLYYKRTENKNKTTDPTIVPAKNYPKRTEILPGSLLFFPKIPENKNVSVNPTQKWIRISPMSAKT